MKEKNSVCFILLHVRAVLTGSLEVALKLVLLSKRLFSCSFFIVQIEPHDYIAELYDAVTVCASITFCSALTVMCGPTFPWAISSR